MLLYSGPLRLSRRIGRVTNVGSASLSVRARARQSVQFVGGLRGVSQIEHADKASNQTYWAALQARTVPNGDSERRVNFCGWVGRLSPAAEAKFRSGDLTCLDAGDNLNVTDKFSTLVWL